MSITTPSHFHQFDEAKWNFASPTKSTYKQVDVNSAAIHGERLPTDAVSTNDDISFWDVLDIINPLQHIPFVSSLYQEITGDRMQSFSRILGDTLYGGVLGAASGITNEILADTTGHDLAGHVMALVTPEENDLINTQIAQNNQKPLTIEIQGRHYVDDTGNSIIGTSEPASKTPTSSNKQSLLQDEMTLSLLYLQEELQFESLTKQSGTNTNIA